MPTFSLRAKQEAPKGIWELGGAICPEYSRFNQNVQAFNWFSLTTGKSQTPELSQRAGARSEEIPRGRPLDGAWVSCPPRPPPRGIS